MLVSLYSTTVVFYVSRPICVYDVSIHYTWVAVVLITVDALNALFYSCVQIDIFFYILCILPDINHFMYYFSIQWSLTRDVHHNQF